jgi:Ca2+-binding EF-hand superfamily protein
MISNEEEDYVQGRKKTLRKKLMKFGLNKENIEQDDIKHIFEKMKITIDSEEAQKIFQDLDPDKTGKVKMEKFVEAITLSQKSQSSYSNILKQINDGLITVSERIIMKLKKLKNKATFTSDMESLEDIEWYLNFKINI